MKLLELFSGTGSVNKAVGNMFDEIVSIDILPKFNPTECVNILDWDYHKYPPHYFDCIWASPPCTHYSTAYTRGIRDIEGANQIVLRTLEIIEYFQPNKWFIENVN
jgi:site-specific DNA-cytosine methylase